jgi:hypothetical protein
MCTLFLFLLLCFVLKSQFSVVLCLGVLVVLLLDAQVEAWRAREPAPTSCPGMPVPAQSGVQYVGWCQ